MTTDPGPVIFITGGLIWFVIGLPAMAVIGWYRWQKLGQSVTLGDVAGGLAIAFFAGGLLYGFLILYFLFEIVDWKRPVLQGRNGRKKGGSDYY